jgi:hypothetical protein
MCPHEDVMVVALAHSIRSPDLPMALLDDRERVRSGYHDDPMRLAAGVFDPLPSGRPAQRRRGSDLAAW